VRRSVRRLYSSHELHGVAQATFNGWFENTRKKNAKQDKKRLLLGQLGTKGGPTPTTKKSRPVGERTPQFNVKAKKQGDRRKTRHGLVDPIDGSKSRPAKGSGGKWYQRKQVSTERGGSQCLEKKVFIAEDFGG